MHRFNWMFLSVALCGCTVETTKSPESKTAVGGQKTEQPPASNRPSASDRERVTALINAASGGVMNKPGLVGAVGGARVRMLQAGRHRVLLPVPQLVEGQVPICWLVDGTPADAITGYRLKDRGDGNVVANIELKGAAGSEVQIDWSAVVLVAGRKRSAAPNSAKPYLSATACVQSDAKKVVDLAQDLWPENRSVVAFAANIQKFVREMKQTRRPGSLDALEILDCGANRICTANANLALAFLRSKGIASRSLAVIPPISQRLEMHRIVEYFDDGRWRAFDPSSVHPNVPMQPWQSIILARTTIADENQAMKPRMSAMPGAPFGQEAELLTPGITLWGRDFFWTLARPLAEFEVDERSLAATTATWRRFLKTGTLQAGQVPAAKATSASELVRILESAGP